MEIKYKVTKKYHLKINFYMIVYYEVNNKLEVRRENKLGKIKKKKQNPTIQILWEFFWFLVTCYKLVKSWEEVIYSKLVNFYKVTNFYKLMSFIKITYYYLVTL